VTYILVNGDQLFTVNCSFLLQIILKMEAVGSSRKLVPVYAAKNFVSKKENVIPKTWNVTP